LRDKNPLIIISRPFLEANAQNMKILVAFMALIATARK
jgi:hypothetical protein